MAEEIEYIDHDGRIEAIDLEKGIVTVSLTEDEDCGGCPASKLCQNFISDNNRIEIHVKAPFNYKIGEEVTVQGSERLHRKAIMLLTVIPSVALIAIMIGIYLLTGSQLASSLCAIGAMIVFFYGLYLMRNRLAHEFVFEIKKK